MVKKRNLVRTTINWIIVIVICSYISLGLTLELFPQPQFLIEKKVDQENSLIVCTYHNQGTEFAAKQIGDNTYIWDIPQGYWEHEYHIEVTVDAGGGEVLSAKINGVRLKPEQIINSDNKYLRINYVPTIVALIRTTEITVAGISCFLFFFFLFVVLCVMIWREIRFGGYGTLCKALLCGGSAVPHIGKKTIIVAALGVLLSCIVAVGNDVNGFTFVMNMFSNGIDYYQLQAAVSWRYQLYFPSFPYNMPMFLFYSLGTLPASLCESIYTANEYHIFNYLLYKIINGCLLVFSIISLLSFFEKRGYIAGRDCKSAFLWSFFNPLIFYVAIIFIQLDALPVCLITIGCLLLFEKKMPILSGVLLGTGLACKMQNLMAFPLVAALFVFLFLKDRLYKDSRKILKSALFLVVSFCVFLLPNFKSSSPVYVMFQYVPQTERIWGLVIHFTNDVFVYVTPGILILALLIYFLHFRTGCSKESVLLSTFLMIGSMALLFSSSLFSTPSTYIQVLGAVVICCAFKNDNLYRFIFSGISSMVAFEYMLSYPGVDIFSLAFHLQLPISFDSIIEKLIAAGLPYMNLVFTISHVAMIVLGCYFCKKSISLLDNNSLATKML